jgi:hypothetical protein
MEHRFKYGFAEFNSANYAGFNVGPMANFIQFALPEDAVMAERMKIIMDLLLYDLASNMYGYNFMAPTARAYVYNMTGKAGDRMRKFTDYIWELNEDWKDSRHRMLINYISMTRAADGNGEKYYEVPAVMKEIGNDRETRIVKSSTGLNLSEIAEKGYIGHGDEQIMMQFGMEAFTNPEVIRNTITYFSKYKMLRNSAINDFRYFNLTLFKSTRLGTAFSENLNPMPNGVALQRANIYTYRTPYYQLATAQAYHPGSYGASQLLSIANFTDDAVVFTAHPARYGSESNAEKYPGYWAGYGRAPHGVQYENIQLSIYRLPEKSGFLELYDVPQFTHTYLPEAFFDVVEIDGRYAFARVGDAYLALIGASPLRYLEYDGGVAKAFRNGLEDMPGRRFDLVQDGLNQFWVYELGDAGRESFAAFKQRVRQNPVNFDGKGELSYISSGKTFSLKYGGGFLVDGQIQDLEYKRFESDYVVSEREAGEMVFSFNGRYLRVNYDSAEREYN